MEEKRSTKSDLELFTREITWDTTPTLSKFYSPIAFGAIGFGVAFAANLYSRRPLSSGMYIIDKSNDIALTNCKSILIHKHCLLIISESIIVFLGIQRYVAYTGLGIPRNDNF